MSDQPPRYSRYRGRPSQGQPGAHDPLSELREMRRAEAQGRPPQYGDPGTHHQPPRGRAPIAPRRGLRPPRSLGRRIVKWGLGLAVFWVVLSGVVFMVSATLHQADVQGGDAVLGGGGMPPFGESVVLLIGSDKRPKNSQEPGANTSGYGLADSIMLLRVGGGSTHKLSIARDTIVNIPGHGFGKINSAYAYGGPALLVRTVEGFTGINVNHVMQISFSDFPGLIDAMGGINYKGSCVISKISGGYKNGGVTLRIRSGEKVHLNGKQALALARTRKNACNPTRENDLTRAHRQQKVLSAMKWRALSPMGFLRLPLIAWEAPKTMDSDMGGPRLVGVMAGMVLGGGKTSVLGTLSGRVPDALKQQKVSEFLGK